MDRLLCLIWIIVGLSVQLIDAKDSSLELSGACRNFQKELDRSVEECQAARDADGNEFYRVARGYHELKSYEVARIYYEEVSLSEGYVISGTRLNTYSSHTGISSLARECDQSPE